MRKAVIAFGVLVVAGLAGTTAYGMIGSQWATPLAVQVLVRLYDSNIVDSRTWVRPNGTLGFSDRYMYGGGAFTMTQGPFPPMNTITGTNYLYFPVAQYTKQETVASFNNTESQWADSLGDASMMFNGFTQTYTYTGPPKKPAKGLVGGRIQIDAATSKGAAKVNRKGFADIKYNLKLKAQGTVMDGPHQGEAAACTLKLKGKGQRQP